MCAWPTFLAEATPSNRVSKFKRLKGFVERNDNNEIELEYVTGRDVGYPKVGKLYHIDHPKDGDINNRVVVIFRTNNDSWSCYGFCKHPDRDDCEDQAFKDEHAEVVGQVPDGRNPVDDVPRIAVQLRDAGGAALNVDSDLWINCRQMLDIKHTVRLTPIGSVHQDSMVALLSKGKRVFNTTFGDRDRRGTPQPTAEHRNSLPQTSMRDAARGRRNSRRRSSSSNIIHWPVRF